MRLNFRLNEPITAGIVKTAFETICFKNLFSILPSTRFPVAGAKIYICEKKASLATLSHLPGGLICFVTSHALFAHWIAWALERSPRSPILPVTFLIFQRDWALY